MLLIREQSSGMDLAHALLLIIAGIAGGTISSLVGGAALVTYPALLAIGDRKSVV